jgi:hypothetical protein
VAPVKPPSSPPRLAAWPIVTGLPPADRVAVRVRVGPASVILDYEPAEFRREVAALARVAGLTVGDETADTGIPPLPGAEDA